MLFGCEVSFDHWEIRAGPWEKKKVGAIVSGADDRQQGKSAEIINFLLRLEGVENTSGELLAFVFFLRVSKTHTKKQVDHLIFDKQVESWGYYWTCCFGTSWSTSPALYGHQSLIDSISRWIDPMDQINSKVASQFHLKVEDDQCFFLLQFISYQTRQFLRRRPALLRICLGRPLLLGSTGQGDLQPLRRK